MSKSPPETSGSFSYPQGMKYSFSDSLSQFRKSDIAVVEVNQFTLSKMV